MSGLKAGHSGVLSRCRSSATPFNCIQAQERRGDFSTDISDSHHLLDFPFKARGRDVALQSFPYKAMHAVSSPLAYLRSHVDLRSRYLDSRSWGVHRRPLRLTLALGEADEPW